MDDLHLFVDVLSNTMKRNPGNILIVASSDMSHFHSYETANRMDAIALKDIAQLNVDSLRQHLQKEECELCGAQGVLSLLMLARKMNARATILNYANSGDVTKNRSKVVGYC